MRWVKKTRVNFFRLIFRLADPVEKVKFFNWIPQSKNSVEKVESKKLLFDGVRKPDLGFSQKGPFSTDKSDSVRNSLRKKNEINRKRSKGDNTYQVSNTLRETRQQWGCNEVKASHSALRKKLITCTI